MKCLKLMKYVVLLACLLVALPAGAAQYPNKPLQMVVPWNPGGSADIFARSYTGILETILVKSVVVNKAGASGLVGLQYGLDRPADGYTIMITSAEPANFRVMDMSTMDYSSFEPVMQLGTTIQTITVRPDAPWNSVAELVDYAKANPGTVKVAHAGPGTDGHIAQLYFQEALGAQFHGVAYGSGDKVRVAAMGGHVDLIFNNLSEVAEAHKGGKLKILATISHDPVEGLDGVPPITQAVPGFEKYLPWGPFKGILVKKGTPKPIVDTLIEASQQVVATPRWQEFIKNAYVLPTYATGAEFDQVLLKDQARKAWLLQDAGVALKNPEEFGIKRP